MDYSKLCSDFLGICIEAGVPILLDKAKQIPYEAYQMSKYGTKNQEYKLLVQETEFIYNLHQDFKKYIQKIEKLQTEHGLEICNIKEYKFFSKSLDILLEGYKETIINKSLKLYDPNWYRLQLQNYVQFMHSFFENMKTLHHDIKKEIERINQISDRRERSQAWEKLRRELKCLEPSN